MHRALGINEILSGIMSAFAGNPNSYPRRTPDNTKALAALARVSRAISDAALRELWSDIQTLKNHLRCFPEEIWTVRERKMCFLRPPEPSEWNRFNYYAEFVKSATLRMGREKHTMDFSNIIHDISCYRVSSGPLLPNLASLAVSIEGDETWSLCRLLLWPNMDSLKISLSLLTSPLTLLKGQIFLTYLPILCPQLRSLKLGYMGATYEVLKHLASLPNLRHIDICASEHSYDFFGRRSFRTLETIRIVSLSSIEAVSSLIGQISSGKLHCVHLEDDQNNVSLNDIRSLCVSLAQIAADTVTELHLSTPVLIEDVSERTSYAVHISYLEPLATFKHLRVVEFARRDCVIDDDALSRMSSWWPELKELHLAGCGFYRACMTLRGVVTFIAQCKKLEVLCVVLDITGALPAFGNILIHKHRNQAFRLLDVDRSPISEENISPIAVILSAIAPNLCCLNWDTDTQYSGCWYTVKRCLDAVGMARTYESSLKQVEERPM